MRRLLHHSVNNTPSFGSGPDEGKYSMLNNFNIFGLQVGLTFVSFILIARSYIWPRVISAPGDAGLRALVATNMFRQIGLAFVLSPQIVGSDVPHSWTEPIAYGDLVSVVLAIVAFAGLNRRAAWARGMTWIFNIVGFVDFINAYAQGVMLQAWTFNLGFAWLIATLLAPPYMVIHVMIFMCLLKRPGKQAGA